MSTVFPTPCTVDPICNILQLNLSYYSLIATFPCATFVLNLYRYFILSIFFYRIKLNIPHTTAGCIAAIRAGMEALLVDVTKDPEYIRQMDPVNQKMLNLIRLISKPSAAGLNLMVSSSR